MRAQKEGPLNNKQVTLLLRANRSIPWSSTKIKLERERERAWIQWCENSILKYCMAVIIKKMNSHQIRLRWSAK